MNKYLYLFIIFFIFSCKHDLEKPRWEIDMTLPISHIKMNVYDIIPDSTTILTSSNQLVSLIFNDNLINTDLDSIIKIDAETERESKRMEDVIFNDLYISDTITLGSVINDIPFGSILFPNGSNSSIPYMQGVASNDTSEIDASEYFETMTLSQGYLSIEIYNGFPTDLSNITMMLVNKINQEVIGSFNIPFVSTGNSVRDSIDISGKTLDEKMIAILVNMDVEASNGNVQINYGDNIITSIILSQIKLQSATALFPEQEIHQANEEHTFNLKDAKISEIKIKEGNIKIVALSTLPDTGRIFYNIPSLTKNGLPFESENILPPTINGETTIIEYEFDEYILNLKGKPGRLGGDTINTIYTELKAFIDSTGEIVTINDNDSFFVYVEFYIIPEYAKGYIGQDTLTFGPEEININTFSDIIDGDLDLEQVNLSISIENFVGIDASLIFDQLNTENTNDNNPPQDVGQDQYGEDIIGKPYMIDRASLTNDNLPIIPTYTEIILDASEMINILPDKINMESTIHLNPNGEQSTSDFLYPDFSIYANLETEIPLSLIANNLTFLKIVDINESEISQLEEIYINVSNGLPIHGNISLILLDENDNILDTLINHINIMSANVNINNIVESPSITTLTLQNIHLENASKIKSISSFTTSSITEHVKILSEYELNVIISGRKKIDVN